MRVFTVNEWNNSSAKVNLKSQIRSKLIELEELDSDVVGSKSSNKRRELENFFITHNFMDGDGDSFLDESEMSVYHTQDIVKWFWKQVEKIYM